MENAKKVEKYITEYTETDENTDDIKTYYQLYICKCSKKIKGLKVQKRIIRIEDLKEAQKQKEKWNERLIRLLIEKESIGYSWADVVEKWELYWREFPTRTFNDDTMRDHLARIYNWTQCWMDKPANEINVADVRYLIKDACNNGASSTLRSMIKRTVNLVIKWAIEEGYITKYQVSPAKNVEILMPNEPKKSEKKPEILTWHGIHKLLTTGERLNSEWFPVWLVALHAGLRSGELEALSKDNIQLVPMSVAEKLDLLPDGDSRKSYGSILVEWAWKQKQRVYGPTKAHYWREVPINQELYYFLLDYLKNDYGVNKYPVSEDEQGVVTYKEMPRLFPELTYWKRGEQAKVLRLFCEANKLQSIKFHTLRACFATQLLAMGVSEEQVRLIGGWSDVETMRIYVRAAGILQSGATQGLKFMQNQEEYDLNSPYRNVDFVKGSELEKVHTANAGALKMASGSSEMRPKNVVDFNAFRRK